MLLMLVPCIAAAGGGGGAELPLIMPLGFVLQGHRRKIYLSYTGFQSLKNPVKLPAAAAAAPAPAAAAALSAPAPAPPSAPAGAVFEVVRAGESKCNGYYRLESRCEPCPCTWMTFSVVLLAVFIVAVLLLFALDLLGDDFTAHASTIIAPLMITVSLVQTMAIFVDTDIPWPSLLRRLMSAFSFM